MMEPDAAPAPVRNAPHAPRAAPGPRPPGSTTRVRGARWRPQPQGFGRKRGPGPK